MSSKKGKSKGEKDEVPADVKVDEEEMAVAKDEVVNDENMEDTSGSEDDEDMEDEEEEDDEDDDAEEESEATDKYAQYRARGNNDRSSVYMPGDRLEDDEILDYDETAYVMLHQAQTGAPCLSFDIIPDSLGDDRTTFPHTAYIVAGTQAVWAHTNSVIVMKMSNLVKTQMHNEDSELSDDESDVDSDVEVSPDLESAIIPHHGAVNRVRFANIAGVPLAATWSELSKVHIWNLTDALNAVENEQAMNEFISNKKKQKPVFTFSGHTSEGFAVDWSQTVPGMLATGDGTLNIHVWKPHEGGTWNVSESPYVGHKEAVEDIQWSPNEANVFASCSVDKSVRIWDARAAPNAACMLTVDDAHEADVNVIHWNRNEPYLVSGGDDNVVAIWDIRQIKDKKPSATFKHHHNYITTVEWHPTDSSVFASGGADDQIVLWDLALERDPEEGSNEEDLAYLPPQLLFIHQGQKQIKELHWHPQIPGVIISTANTGFNVFKTISA